MNISTNSKIFELNKEGACSFTYKRPCKPWIMNVQMNKKHTLSVTPNKPTYSNQNQKGPERISYQKGYLISYWKGYLTDE